MRVRQLAVASLPAKIPHGDEPDEEGWDGRDHEGQTAEGGHGQNLVPPLKRKIWVRS